MKTVNRVVIVILLLVAMVLCTLSLVVPVRVFNAVARQSNLLVDFLGRLRPIVRVPLGILFALALDVIFILLIVLEVRRSAPKAIRIKQAAGGEVMVSTASIADRLKEEIESLSTVMRSQPKVSARRGRVVVELGVEAAAGINVPEEAEKIVEATRRVVEERMGLKLARAPKVNLHAVSHPIAPKSRPPALRKRGIKGTDDVPDIPGQPRPVPQKRTEEPPEPLGQ